MTHAGSGYWADGVWHPPEMRFDRQALREADRLDRRCLAAINGDDLESWRTRINPSGGNWRSKIPPGGDAKLKELEEGFEYSDPNIEKEDSGSIKRPSRIVVSTLVFMLGLQQLAGMALPFGLSSWKGSPSYPERGDLDSLIAAYPVVCYWEADPSTFNAAFCLAVSVSAAAVVTGVALLIDCVVKSVDNAQKASDVHYSDAIEAAWQVIENYLSALSGSAASGESTANIFGEPMVTSTDSTTDGTTDAGELFAVSSVEEEASRVRAMRLTPGLLVASRASVGSSGQPAKLAGGGAVRGNSGGHRNRPGDVAKDNGSASGEGNTASPGMHDGVQAPIDVDRTIARPVTDAAEPCSVGAAVETVVPRLR